MVNKNVTKGNARRTGYRRHEPHNSPQSSPQQRRPSQEALTEPSQDDVQFDEYKVSPLQSTTRKVAAAAAAAAVGGAAVASTDKRRGSVANNRSNRLGSEHEHENAIEYTDDESYDCDDEHEYTGSDVDCSHVKRPWIRPKKANTRFRRHSTPAELQELQEKQLAQQLLLKEKIKANLSAKKRESMCGQSLSAIESSETSEYDDYSDSESEAGRNNNNNVGSGRAADTSPIGLALGPSGERTRTRSSTSHKLTRKQRRQEQLRKQQKRDTQLLQEVKDSYAEGFDSDSSIDLTEVNEIERKYFEQKRQQELRRLTEEWEYKMKIGKIQQTGVYLPPEILDIIFEQMGEDFHVGVVYVCKSWYSVGIEHLYKAPKLGVRNYHKFVETLGNKGNLGHLVKKLDLRNIIQSGKPSLTAKVMKRCKTSLQILVAPQTSFGYAPSVALKSCRQLRVLDLSLVSETVDLRVLFSAIANAKHLERLDFPRSSVFCEDYSNEWPESIWNLGLSGGISNEFLESTKFPSSITHLTLSHCPFVMSDTIRNVCGRLGPYLKSLRVLYPLPALRPNTFDTVFVLCPELETLIVAVDYITRHMFDESNLPYDKHGHAQPHPLKYLTVDSSGSLGSARKLDADDITLAVLEERLPRLSQVRVSSKLGWSPKAEEMSELAEVLDDNGGGVWIYNQLD